MNSRKSQTVPELLLGLSLLLCASAAVRADHLVFIADGKKVRVLDIATLTPVAVLHIDVNAECGSGNSRECPGFDDGKHMVVDSIGRRIFVSDHDSDFMVFDFNLCPIQVFPEFGISLSEPLGIAPLPNGQLLITDEEDSNGLFRLNGDLSLDAQATGEFSFCGAEGVAYDAVHDRIYVADEDDNRIDIFNGTTLAHITSVGIDCTSNGAYWLGVDGSSNHLFVLADSTCNGPERTTLSAELTGLVSNYGIHVYDISSGGDALAFNQTLFGSAGGSQDCYGTLAVSESTDRLFAIDYCSDTVDIYDTLTLEKLGTVPSNGEDPLMVSVGDMEIQDCNGNGVPDNCDVACAASGGVCDTNGFFRECNGSLWRFDFRSLVEFECFFPDLYMNEVRYLCFDTSNQLVRNWIEVGDNYLNVQYPSTDGPSYTAYRFDSVMTTGTDRRIDPATYVFQPAGGILHFEEQVDAEDEANPSWQEWGTTIVDGAFDAVGSRIEGTWEFQSVQEGSVCGEFTAVKLSADCNGNGIPDECEPDCNENGTPDDCDIAEGTSLDCNGNGIPDECEIDGDGDGVIDDCDNCPATANPGQEDADGNGVGDACEPAPEPEPQPAPCGLGATTISLFFSLIFHAPVCGLGCPAMLSVTILGLLMMKRGFHRRRRRSRR